MYASAWRAFQSWTRARGVLAMPASTPLIAAYLSHLAEDRRLSVTTMSSLESKVSWKVTEPFQLVPILSATMTTIISRLTDY